MKHNKPLYTFSIVLGLLSISFILWNRLIRGFLPKSIDDFLLNNYLQFLVYVNVIIIFVRICFLILNLIKKTPVEEVSFIFAYIRKLPGIIVILRSFIWLDRHVINSPKITYNFLFKNYNIAHLVERPLHTLSKKIKELNKKKQKVIFFTTYFCLNAVPKIFIAFVFFFEILFNQELKYFYKSLILFLLPLLYSVISWILNDLCDKNTYYATAHINLTYYDKDNYDIQFKKETPLMEDAVDITTRQGDYKLLEWVAYIYMTYVDIKWLLHQLQKIKEQFGPYETIIISLMYLVGWLYILLHSFL